MSIKRIETISRTSSVETVDKTPAEKAWETRRRNKIAAQKEQLSNSIPSPAHKQWMTKKDKEIAEKDKEIAEKDKKIEDLKQQLAEQKSKKKQSRK